MFTRKKTKLFMIREFAARQEEVVHRATCMANGSFPDSLITATAADYLAWIVEPIILKSWTHFVDKKLNMKKDDKKLKEVLSTED